VLTGEITLRVVFETLEPFMLREEKTVLKTSDKYINSDETSILLEALAIEDGKKASFLVLLGKRDDGLVIRLYPEIDVEKTDGVKTVLARIASQLLEKISTLTVGKTNLQEFLEKSQAK
jgi:hypothetical protein